MDKYRLREIGHEVAVLNSLKENHFKEALAAPSQDEAFLALRRAGNVERRIRALRRKIAVIEALRPLLRLLGAPRWRF